MEIRGSSNDNQILSIINGDICIAILQNEKLIFMNNFQMPIIPIKLPNPNSLSIQKGYNTNIGTYDGSSSRTITVPYMTFHTSEPGTVHDGEIWAVYE